MRRRDVLLGGAAVSALARAAAAQCVTDTVAVDACRGGVYIGGPGLPSLDLDFTGGALPGGVTFTRASTATNGLYTDAAGSSFTSYTTDQPRFANGGLLIEEQRSNSLLNSGAPVTQTTASLAGGGVMWCLWVIGTGSATPTAGTAVGTGLGVAATAGNPSFFTLTTAGTVVVTVAGSLNRFQLERSLSLSPGFPTSYIPTTGATATRAADLCTVPSGAWYNAAASTYYAEAIRFWVSSGVQYVVAMYAGVVRVGLNLRAASNNSTICAQDAGNLVNLSATAPPDGVVFRAAAAFRDGRQAGSLNGGPVANMAFATTSPGLTTLGIGSYNNGNVFCGSIRRVKYWASDLSDGNLQQVTLDTNPSLDLNFTGGTLDPRFTFTRASTATSGTYLDAPGSSYTSYANDAPRLLPNGLLIETQSTNILLNSAAPATQSVSIVASRSYILWVIGTGTATVTAGTAVLTSGAGGVASAGAPVTVFASTPGTITVTVAGSLNRFQLEWGTNQAATAPTSYIPTTGAAASRLGDLCTMPTAGWYDGAAPASLAVEAMLSAAPTANVWPVVQLDDASQNNRLTVQVSPGVTAVRAGNYYTAGTLDVSLVKGGVTAGIPFSAVISWSATAAAMSLNGDAPSAAVPTHWPGVALTRLAIGNGASNAGWFMNGFMRGLRYWPRNLL